MKYLVIKPVVDAEGISKKELLEYDKNKISDPVSFIQQQVQGEPVPREIGDYTFWVSNPEVTVEDIDYTYTVSIDNPLELLPNILIDEFEFVYGNTVVTANHQVEVNNLAGLAEQDIAYLMNLFKSTQKVMILYKGQQIAVDRVLEQLLAPNGLREEIVEEPPTPVIPDFDELEGIEGNNTEKP